MKIYSSYFHKRLIYCEEVKEHESLLLPKEKYVENSKVYYQDNKLKETFD